MKDVLPDESLDTILLEIISLQDQVKGLCIALREKGVLSSGMQRYAWVIIEEIDFWIGHCTIDCPDTGILLRRMNVQKERLERLRDQLGSHGIICIEKDIKIKRHK